MKYSLFILLLSIFINAHGADVNCSYTGELAKSGPAKAFVECGELKGALKDDTPIQKLTVNVVSPDGSVKNYEIKEINGILKDYIPPGRSTALVNILTSYLGYGDKIEIAPNGIFVDDKTVLYEGDRANQTPKSSIAELLKNTSNQKSSIVCQYGLKEDEEKFTSIVETPKFCQGKKMCVGLVTCSENGKDEIKLASCASNGDECPDATSCALDEKLTLELAKK